jgi:hypothetical protein
MVTGFRHSDQLQISGGVSARQTALHRVMQPIP